MTSRFLASAAAGLAFSKLVAGQLFSDCNPTLLTTCAPNPAFGDNGISVDFTEGVSSEFTVLAGTAVTYDSSKGAVFSMSTVSDSPTMVSNKYLFYGRIDVVIQAAPGNGIVTALTLQSEDLDEIDLEWVGYDTTHVQTNYFSQGITGNYDRGGFSDISSNCFENYHTYSMDWTSTKLEWLIDGVVVRTLVRDDTVAAAYRYPQTPSRVRLGTWVAGQASQASGTIEWAGGLANFTDGPAVAYLKSITVTDYANGVSGAVEYEWTDQTGEDSSIKVITEADASSSASASASASSTSTDTSSSASSTGTDATTTGNVPEGTSSDATTATGSSDAAHATGTDSDVDATSTDCDDDEPTATHSGHGSPSKTSSSGDDDDEDCDDDDEGEGEGSIPTASYSTTIVMPTTAVSTCTDGSVTTIVVDMTVTVPCDESGTPLTSAGGNGWGSGSHPTGSVSMTTVVKPTTAVSTAANGEVTTVVVDVTVTVPCDQATATGAWTSAVTSAPNTLATVTTKTIIPGTKTVGWAPIKSGGVGFAPAYGTPSGEECSYGSASGSGSGSGAGGDSGNYGNGTTTAVTSVAAGAGGWGSAGTSAAVVSSPSATGVVEVSAASAMFKLPAAFAAVFGVVAAIML